MFAGNGNRTQHATDANSESSRSHAVLQVFLKQKDKAAGLSSEVKLAKMSLIDLAGSEKGCVTGNKGARWDNSVVVYLVKTSDFKVSGRV